MTDLLASAQLLLDYNETKQQPESNLHRPVRQSRSKPHCKPIHSCSCGGACNCSAYFGDSCDCPWAKRPETKQVVEIDDDLKYYRTQMIQQKRQMLMEQRQRRYQQLKKREAYMNKLTKPPEYEEQ